MKRNIALFVLFSLSASQMQAGVSGWLTDHYRSLIATAVVSIGLGRAAWAKYMQHKIIRDTQAPGRALHYNKVGIATNKGAREEMEDTASVFVHGYTDTIDAEPVTTRNTIGGIVTVADGHGGKKVASMVAESLSFNLMRSYPYAQPSFWSIFFKGKPKLILGPNIKQGFETTNLKILDDEQLNNQGATAVTAFRHENDLYVAHVGDAGALLISKNSHKKLTTDHNFADPQELARAERAGATIETRSNGVRKLEKIEGEDTKHIEVSRSFGDKTWMPSGMIGTPTISQHSVSKDDEVVLLATDGIWEQLEPETIANIVRNGLKLRKSLAEISQQIIDEASIAPIERGIACAEKREYNNKLKVTKMNTRPSSDNPKEFTLDQWRKLREEENNRVTYIVHARAQANDNQTVALLALK